MLLNSIGLAGLSLTRTITTTGQRLAINHEFHKIIKWVKPEYKDAWAPQRSCDLRPLPKIDPNWLKLEYRPFTDLIQKLPEDHRKIFTVGFAARRDGVAVIMEDTISLVKRHKYDKKSVDVKIAWATIRIRDYQVLFATDPFAKRSGVFRNTAKELIEKRKKWLTRMRYTDYKRFEWIIEVLGILYKPNSQHTRIERKASINVLVNMFCNEIREKKIQEYKNMLESEKIPFLEMKLNTLEKIKEDEDSINIPCSVLEEIKDTKKLLEELTKSHLTVYPVGQSLPESNASLS